MHRAFTCLCSAGLLLAAIVLTGQGCAPGLSTSVTTQDASNGASCAACSACAASATSPAACSESNCGDCANESEATLLTSLEAQDTRPSAEESTNSESSAADPLDWPYWRGPHYNGISYETGLVDDWNPRGGANSNIAWKRDDLGTRSTPIVMNGKLYVLCRAEPRTPREGERVVCLDAATGQTLWENRFNVWLSDVPKERVAWSSVVGDPDTGNVYALGVCGYFLCMNGETGETIWSIPLHEQFGLLSTYGGRTNFPVICEDLVIISGVVIGWGEMAKPAHRWLAFDKRTGQVVWFNSTTELPEDTTYSGPVVTVINNQQALVFGAGDGMVWALQARTGKPIWKYEFSRRGINTNPVVLEDGTVIAAHSEENNVGTAMGGIVALDGSGSGNISKSGEKWRRFEVMVGKSSPVVVGDRIYCVDDGANMMILDKNTGEFAVPEDALSRVVRGTVMRASLLYADGKIYCMTQTGLWYILKPDPEKGVVVVSRGRLPTGESVDASPIVSHGRVYITTSGGIYCLQDTSKTPGVEQPPAPPQEPPASEDPEVAQVQLVPAELLIESGTSQKFEVRLYNSRGQFLRTAPAELSLEGPGSVDSEGNFTAPADARHTATYVTAKVGDLTGRARVRIVPPLPWSFDFEGLKDAPITWVGARYRHVMREVDGSNVLVKITTIPKGTRSRSWMGSPELHNYTIQADVMGAGEGDRMPSIGLIAQGYVLDLQGVSQLPNVAKSVEIRTWAAERRMAVTLPFDWKPQTWYTMKFRAAVEDGQAVLRGKIWPKGEAEPEAWTIEATDEVPNLQGSPGLYGDAREAEIFLDNIQVTAND